MWLFGYGSLIWKVDFPVKRQITGFIQGYVRRFYQGSIDHRGVPEKPGRVVTLILTKNPCDSVWGVAYEIAEEDVSNVLKHLDLREKNGYDKVEVIFYPKENTEKSFPVFLYIAQTSNSWFLGETDIDDIARQIADAEGPSGSNSEYLFQLAAAMRELAPECNDAHLFQLESAVKRIFHEKSCKR